MFRWCVKSFSKIGDIKFLKNLIWKSKQNFSKIQCLQSCWNYWYQNNVIFPSKILHWKGFFSSWTQAKCPFKFAFCAKLASQILHSKGFFPLWTDVICSFNWYCWVKAKLQISHLKGFFPSWTEAMCPFKWFFTFEQTLKNLIWKSKQNCSKIQCLQSCWNYW